MRGRPDEFDIIGVVRDAGITLRSNLKRAIAIALATAIGVGGLVAVRGLSSTVSGQMSSRFDALEATAVRAVPVEGQVLPTTHARVDQRFALVEGVESAGVSWGFRGSKEVTSNGISVMAKITAATPGFLDAADADVAPGWPFDGLSHDQGQRVALVGKALLRQLPIGPLEQSPHIAVDGVPFVVIGVIESSGRSGRLLDSIVVPGQTAEEFWPGEVFGQEVIVEVYSGWAQAIGPVVPLVLRPDNPASVEVFVPPSPETLRMALSSDLSRFLWVFSLIALLAGCFVMGSSSLVSVLRRAPEIGLRKAFGASRLEIGMLFVVEASVLAAVGAAAGSVIGTAVVVLVSYSHHWTPILDPFVLLWAPLGGCILGAFSGLLPALKAAGLDPVTTLRGGE